MKKIKDWFEELEEPYRSEAILNTSIEDLDTDKDSLTESLAFAFSWNDSKQGWRYWYKLYDSLEERGN